MNCGAALPTAFCAQCGEQRASDRHYSLFHFGEEILESFAHLDGSLFRTLKALVRRPGELTAAYMRGERSRYMKPLQLFVIVSVAYFVVAVATNVRTFDTPLRYQVAQWEKPARMVARRVAERQTTLAQYSEIFNHTSTTQAKTLVIVMIPVFAVLVAAIEFRKRRFALHHVVFSLHTYTALLILLMGADLLVFPPMSFFLRQGALLLHTSADGVLSLLTLAGVFAYLRLSLARAYGDGRLSALLKASVMVLGMVAILLAYRVLLFYTAYWAT